MAEKWASSVYQAAIAVENRGVLPFSLSLAVDDKRDTGVPSRDAYQTCFTSMASGSQVRRPPTGPRSARQVQVIDAARHIELEKSRKASLRSSAVLNEARCRSRAGRYRRGFALRSNRLIRLLASAR